MYGDQHQSRFTTLHSKEFSLHTPGTEIMLKNTLKAKRGF